jgi:exonuclease SbcC
MRIEIVQLENIRSHAKSTVPFTRGFNCLVGGLGCGKSSILYSVDFAFFGNPVGRSFEYLLREDADRGRVTVQFVQNGKTYKITRGLRRRGKGVGQDVDELKFFEGENLISSVKSDAVVEQLKSITGLDEELFREIVWVRQERLKELLDAPPRERQKRLDELFGLADYEAAWSNIGGYQKEYEGERKAYERDPDIVGMEKLGSEYNQTVETLSLLEIEMQETEKRLDLARKTLEDADLKLQKQEDVRNLVEQSRRRQTRIHADLTNTKETLLKLDKNIENKKSSVEGLKQRLALLESQKEAYKAKLRAEGIFPDQPLGVLKQYMAALDDQASNLKAEQEASLGAIRENQGRISSTSAENRCPTCLQRLTEEYKNSLIQRIQEENEEKQKRVAQLQSEIEKMRQTRAEANGALSNLQAIVPRVGDFMSRLNEEIEALAELQEEIETKRKLEKELLVQLEEARAETARFDLSELETARTERDKALDSFHQARSELHTEQSRKGDLAKRLEEVRTRIDHAQQKIERMQRIVKIVEIISGIRDGYRGIQPMLRSEFVKVLRNFVQQVLDNLTSGEGPLLNVMIDESYTPYVKSEGGVEREVTNLSGGERTLLAFAYRLGLGQLIMQSRTGHGLSLLLLDEPTESLGREDGSIDRLAEAISRFRAVEQIIAVTHSEAFAEKAEHVIRLEKESGVSRVSVER